MTDKVITIKHFTAHICQILNEVITSGEEIVITKYRKPCFVLTLYSKKVITSQPEKEKVITNLKRDIKKVITSPEEEPKVLTFCLPCLKAGFKKPAIGEFEVTFDDGERKVPLCEQHKRKYVNA